MRKLIVVIIIGMFLILPVSAIDMDIPEVPETAREVFPKETTSFMQDLWYIVKNGISKLRPSVLGAVKMCLSMVSISLLISLVSHFNAKSNFVCQLVGAISVGTLMISPMNAMMTLATHTIEEMTQYSKLLLPVMTAAMAAQGSVTTSCGLYMGTAFVNSILSSLINKILVPMILIFICLSIANCATSENVLKKLCDFVKWAMTWILKILLYVFTGYMSITGVISGATDASAMKATKLAISGCVPVVGGVLSDASESILISATLMKNTAGIYGILALIAICVVPFLRIAVQYLMLKLTSAVCAVNGAKKINVLIESFSTAMGFMLAMTGVICILQLISTICFMKGVG